MKRYKLSLFVCFVILTSCSTDEKISSIIGRWELTEKLIDPGDGSGKFESTDDYNYIEITQENRLFTDLSLCYMLKDNNMACTGIIDPLEFVIVPDSCNTTTITYYFEASNLILNFPQCFEPCKLKFKKTI